MFTIANLENSTGHVFIALFNNQEGFPSEGRKAMKNAKTLIVNKKATFVFQDLPYGYYAATTYHDENDNNKLETNILGIPKEGVGASNMRNILMGAPRFEMSKFKHQTQETHVTLTMIYDIFKLI